MSSRAAWVRRVMFWRKPRTLPRGPSPLAQVLDPRTEEQAEQFRREMRAIDEMERQGWIKSKDVWIR